MLSPVSPSPSRFPLRARLCDIKGDSPGTGRIKHDLWGIALHLSTFGKHVFEKGLLG